MLAAASRSPQAQTATANTADDTLISAQTTNMPAQQQQQQHPPNQPRPQQQNTPSSSHIIPPGLSLPSSMCREMAWLVGMFSYDMSMFV